MGTKMSNAPVYYALAQVRFNVIAMLDQYVPKIQDTLRRAGYPDFQRLFVATINVNPGAGENQIPAFQQLARYQFLDEKKTSGFILDQSSLSFQTTDYDTFEPFSKAFFHGLDILHGVLELSYSERVGIRFLDAVQPRENEKISLYLAPTVLGLFEQLGEDSLVQAISETRTQKGKIVLVSRSIIQRQATRGIAFPQELLPIPVEITPKFKETTGLYGIIDTDSWTEDRAKFDPGALANTLKLLHDEINRSFSHMVTPYALDVWK